MLLESWSAEKLPADFERALPSTTPLEPLQVPLSGQGGEYSSARGSFTQRLKRRDTFLTQPYGAVHQNSSTPLHHQLLLPSSLQQTRTQPVQHNLHLHDSTKSPQNESNNNSLNLCSHCLFHVSLAVHWKGRSYGGPICEPRKHALSSAPDSFCKAEPAISVTKPKKTGPWNVPGASRH